MKKTGLNKKIFIVLFLVAIICYTGIFISFWNANLKNSHNYLIPLVFLVCGLLCIFLMFFMVNFFLQPASDERKGDDLSQNNKPIFEPIQPKKEFTDARKSASHLLRGISGESDKKIIAGIILKNLAGEFEMVQGMFFSLQKNSGKFHITNTYAFTGENDPPPFIAGEGLSGQAVSDRKIIILKKLPDSYSPVQSGLGKGKPSFLYIIPIIFENEVIGIIEMSTFREIDEERLNILNIFNKNAGDVFIKSLRKKNE
jgi:hypothetical protein